MGKGEGLEAKIEAQLREWTAELESLKAKADKAVAEARKGYYEHVDELREEITRETIDREYPAGSFPHELLDRLDHDGDGEALEMAHELLQEMRA